MTATLIVPSARRGTNLDDRCSPLLPADPEAHTRLCLDCGRVTTRRDPDGSWRCLGALPPFDTCGACGEHLRAYRPGQAVHPNCTPGSARLLAIARDLERAGLPYCACADARRPAGDCAHCKEFAARLRAVTP